MSQELIFKSGRPDEGWTKKYELGDDLVSYEDMISPEFFELEREAIFRPAWHYVGRAERVSKPGMYFTKEIEVLKSSIIVTRDDNKNVRVYYNVCPHRGNKLMWETDASKEVSGRCKTFFCKFHGIQFNTDGKVAMLTDTEAWLGSQGQDLQLAEVPFEVWNGFIFVNLDRGGPKETLQEFMGDKYYQGFSDYPFEKCTQRYFVRANAKANWKTMIDGFSETYHASTTHAKPFNSAPSEHLLLGAEHYGMDGRQRVMVYQDWGEIINFEYERLTQGFGTGPRIKFPDELHDLPKISNPTGLENWGSVSHKIWPQMFIQHYNPGWYVTYMMWPLAYNEMRFEVELFMPPAQNFSDELAQKAGIFMFLDAALQDFSLLEATQQGLEVQAFDKYPLTDEEVLVRHFHQSVQAVVSEYQQKQKANGS
ncbi:MAG: aromatic ring-hydroxylating dioxygenase subunit alpha [Pseudomonadota bacterium]